MSLVNTSYEDLLNAVSISNSKAQVLLNLGYSPDRKLYPALDKVAAKYEIQLPSSRTGNSAKLRQIPKDNIIELTKICTSKKEILFKCGFSDTAQMYKVLNEILIELGISKFNKNKIMSNSATYKSAKQYLFKGSKISSSILRKKLIEENILENCCAECGQKPYWNSKILTLQLDHINGINTDNRLENLRILCPNCHTQTENYCSKNNKENSVQGGQTDLKSAPTTSNR